MFSSTNLSFVSQIVLFFKPLLIFKVANRINKVIFNMVLSKNGSILSFKFEKAIYRTRQEGHSIIGSVKELWLCDMMTFYK